MVCMTIASVMPLTFILGHTCVSNLTTFELAISLTMLILSCYIQTWRDSRLLEAIRAHARFNELDLDAKSQWVGKGKNQRCMLLATKQAISIKLATKVGPFFT